MYICMSLYKLTVTERYLYYLYVNTDGLGPNPSFLLCNLGDQRPDELLDGSWTLSATDELPMRCHLTDIGLKCHEPVITLGLHSTLSKPEHSNGTAFR